jgi:hypothetical protein
MTTIRLFNISFRIKAKTLDFTSKEEQISFELLSKKKE